MYNGIGLSVPPGVTLPFSAIRKKRAPRLANGVDGTPSVATLLRRRPGPPGCVPSVRWFAYPNLELHSDYDVFSGPAERYAKIFGSKGMNAYRERWPAPC